MSIQGTRLIEASTLATMSSALSLLWIAGCSKPPEPQIEAPTAETRTNLLQEPEEGEPTPAAQETADVSDELTEATANASDTIEHDQPASKPATTDPAPIPDEGEPLEDKQDRNVEVAEHAGKGDAFDEFYDELTPFGEWHDTASYGTVWQPAVARNTEWRPYTDGTWAVADEGWTWVSNEPFGAICYHYGRWALLVDFGWVWVPGLEWAPAWVAWRADDQFAGWAPLPPEYTTAYIGADPAYWEQTSYAPGPLCYNYVPIEYLCSTNCAPYLVSYSVGLDLFGRTHSYTRFHRNDRKLICNTGPHERHFTSERKPRKITAEQRELCKRNPHHRSRQERGKGNSKTTRGTRRLVSTRVNRGWPDKDPKVARTRLRSSRPSSPSSGRSRSDQGVTRARSRKPDDDGGSRRRLASVREKQWKEDVERTRKIAEDARRKSEQQESRQRQMAALREKERVEAESRKRERRAREETVRSRAAEEARQRSEQEQLRQQQLAAARERDRQEKEARRRRSEQAERRRKQAEDDARRRSAEEDDRRRRAAAAREKERRESEARKRQSEQAERNRRAAEARRKSEEASRRRQRDEQARRRAASEKAARERQQRERAEREARSRETARRKQAEDRRRQEAERQSRERQARARQEAQRQAEERRRADERRRSESRNRSSSSSRSRGR